MTISFKAVKKRKPDGIENNIFTFLHLDIALFVVH